MRECKCENVRGSVNERVYVGESAREQIERAIIFACFLKLHRAQKFFFVLRTKTGMKVWKELDIDQNPKTKYISPDMRLFKAKVQDPIL